MRIKKTSQTTPTASQIVNTYSNSQTDAYSCNYVNNEIKDVYSTNEVKTNKVWIDGKPIYRKVFVKENIANGSNEDIELSFDSLISISGIVEWNNSYTKHNVYWISSFTGSSNERCDVATNSNGLSFRNRTSSTVKLNLIVEYTKTTD
jgi:hypothetical protein